MGKSNFAIKQLFRLYGMGQSWIGVYHIVYVSISHPMNQIAYTLIAWFVKETDLHRNLTVWFNMTFMFGNPLLRWACLETTHCDLELIELWQICSCTVEWSTAFMPRTMALWTNSLQAFYLMPCNSVIGTSKANEVDVCCWMLTALRSKPNNANWIAHMHGYLSRIQCSSNCNPRLGKWF